MPGIGYNFLVVKGKTTMEEEKIQQMEAVPTQKKKVVIKKVYTPPTLTVYGKLTELTAAGTGNAQESHPDPTKRRP